MSTPRVFCSLFAYSLRKRWEREGRDVNEAVREEIAKKEESDVAGFRAAARLAYVADVNLYVSMSSLLARARSHAAGLFLRSGRDVWVSVDEDVEASEEVLASLVKSASSHSFPRTVPSPTRVNSGIVLTAQVCSGNGRTDINAIVNPNRGREVDGRRVVPCMQGGFSLAAFSWDAIEHMRKAYPHLVYDGESGQGLGIFLETIMPSHDGKSMQWVSEDIVCCRRAQTCGVPVECLLDAEVTHAGVTLDVGVQFPRDPTFVEAV